MTMQNPVTANSQARLNAQIAALPPEVRSAIVAAGISNARAILPVPYWSTVRFTGTVAANALTINAGTIAKGFQYAIGQDMTIAGFTTTTSTPCDTNLLRAGETLDNADVWIYGLCAELCPNSDPFLATQIWRNSLVEISLNGTQSIRLGTLNMFPSGGGLYGIGNTQILLPPLQVVGQGPDGGTGGQFSCLANGNPMSGNFLRFPQPFKWCGVGTGGADASLSVNVTVNRTINFVVAASRAGVAGTTGQWTQPVTGGAGTVVDIRFRLVSVSVARRSVNT